MLFSLDGALAKYGDEYEHTDWMAETYAKMKAGELTSAQVDAVLHSVSQMFSNRLFSGL